MFILNKAFKRFTLRADLYNKLGTFKNTLAHFASVKVTRIKRSKTLATGVNVMKIFFIHIHNPTNKIACSTSINLSNAHQIIKHVTITYKLGRYKHSSSFGFNFS